MADQDFDLVKACQDNDEKAFEQLVTKYKMPVFKIIYSVIGQKLGAQEADDIAQEVFIKVYSNIRSFKFKSSFSTWLYRVAYNECINRARNKKDKFISLDSAFNEDESLQLRNVLRDNSPNIENSALLRELQELIRAAINSLPRKFAMALTLVELEDMSYTEAAQIMDISVNKLKVWLFRARAKLKKKLQPLEKIYGN